jgi:uncharacterized protein YdiU (UPF0061 family)
MAKRISKSTHSSRRRAERGTPKRRARSADSGPRHRKLRERYPRIRAIDGRHPLQSEVPKAIVSYPARRRRDSKITYFNFELAREIGLIKSNHPDRLDAELRRTLLDTFSLVIVNEWDESHGRLPTARDRLPHPYMATRYLQLQHPDGRGQNSGDGRSIWNGMIRTRRGVWDISSCGTGVTRLCPATSLQGRFFQTGNRVSDYGCGTAHVEEGIGAALMSEVFARNGVPTERVLAILSLPSGQAINVRVAANLLRPSHFFGLLRRREDEDLRRCVLYYADREIKSGRWPALRSASAKFRHLAHQVALDFARAAATFESEYIFCWLDWDGDNILTDGSILDYGSVRQFGLYHRDYRFEDLDRFSTSIPEQKRKARQIVQRFAQIRDLLLHGHSTPLAKLREDPVLETFDAHFAIEKRRLFLHKLGLDPEEYQALPLQPSEPLRRLMTLHGRFEKCRSSSGPHPVPDGLSWNAVYCMRDVVRELPQRLLETLDRGRRQISSEAFLEIAISDFASHEDRAATAYRRRTASLYQRAYLEVLEEIAVTQERGLQQLLSAVAPRAAARNPYARMTGDGLAHATRRLANARDRLTPEETYRLIDAFVRSQDLSARTRDAAGPSQTDTMATERPLVRRLHAALRRDSVDFRESL